MTEHPWVVARSGFSPGPWIFLLRAVTVNEHVMPGVQWSLPSHWSSAPWYWPLIGHLVRISQTWTLCLESNAKTRTERWRCDPQVIHCSLICVWFLSDNVLTGGESIILYWPLGLRLWACQVSSRLHTPYTRIILDQGILNLHSSIPLILYIYCIL